MVGSRRLEEIRGHASFGNKYMRRGGGALEEEKEEDGQGNDRRAHTAERCALAGKVLGRFHGSVLLHKYVRTTQNAS